MLKISNVSFSYAKRKPRVLENFSLNLSTGGIYGLLGPNGAGKSTLLYLMTGLLKPTTGTVTYEGVRTWERNPNVLREIFIIPEEFVLPDMTLANYVKAYSPMYPNFSEETMEHCLREFGMENTGNIGSLSMGQKKKIYISFALACHTPLLLMDEPTNGLDIQAKVAFRSLVSQIIDNDQIVVISTHQVRDLEQLLDHILIMNQRQVLLNMPVSDLQRRYAFYHNVSSELAAGALFALQSPGGVNIMVNNDNPDKVCTDPDLELLFSYALKQDKPIVIGPTPATVDEEEPPLPPETRRPAHTLPARDLYAKRNFDMGRFGNYLKLYCITNRNKLLGYSFIALVAIMISQLISPVFTWFSLYDSASPNNYDPYWAPGLFFGLFMISILSCISGSLMFSSNMSNKNKRLSTMSIAVSQFEKWLTWFLVYVVLAYVVFLLSFAISECVRYEMCYFMADNKVNLMCILTNMDKAIAQLPDEKNVLLLIPCTIIAGQSFYILGASVWYRNAFIKTVGLGYVMEYILFFCLIISSIITFSIYPGGADRFFSNQFFYDLGDFIDLNYNTFLLILAVVMLLWAVICYALSYVRQRENGLNFRW